MEWISPGHDIERSRRVRRGKKRCVCVPSATSLLTETHSALGQDGIVGCRWCAVVVVVGGGVCVAASLLTETHSVSRQGDSSWSG